MSKYISAKMKCPGCQTVATVDTVKPKYLEPSTGKFTCLSCESEIAFKLMKIAQQPNSGSLEVNFSKISPKLKAALDQARKERDKVEEQKNNRESPFLIGAP